MRRLLNKIQSKAEEGYNELELYYDDPEYKNSIEVCAGYNSRAVLDYDSVVELRNALDIWLENQDLRHRTVNLERTIVRLNKQLEAGRNPLATKEELDE